MLVCVSLSPAGMYSKNDILVIVFTDTDSTDTRAHHQVMMHYNDKQLSTARFPTNQSFGINKMGKDQGRIIFSALIDDETRLLGFGIDV